MKRFRISWTEDHSQWVEADSLEDAIDQALGENMAPSCDRQTLRHIQEAEKEVAS